jgi:exodeoxyribonuclease V beta subunit
LDLDRAFDAFDLLGPLPTGTTVLEASAGTGKTFTIAGLVARYVAEGVANMDELLVVSFSRESTRELRERVRERLVSARDGLVDPSLVDPRDELLAYLARTDVDARRRRLGEALAAFDAATVTTTHGFCQQVMTALGTAGDHDPGALLVEDIGDLVREVADDLYLRKWGTPGAEAPTMTHDAFQELALAAMSDPATRLVPDPSIAGLADQPLLRSRIAAAVRAEVDRRKRRQHLIDYDDLLLRLAATLSDPEFGPAAQQRLRERYRVVLVDEFQDTDPVQWSILREPFHGPDHQNGTLVLIGDPKQAIYGFRGADVHAYLDAVRVADTVRTLPNSYRADSLLVKGLDAVFRGAALGDRRIRVVPVTAVHQGRMVRTADSGAPLRLRVLPRDGLSLVQNGTVKTGEAREAVVADLAGEVVGLLAGGTRVQPRDGCDERALQPGDIAVLVRTNAQAQLVSQSLGEVGVPVVVTGRASVFATTAASEWQLLLEALEQPHRATRVRRLALGCFVGMTALELASEDDSATEYLALLLRGWARTLDERGVTALFEAVSLSQSVQPRVLGRPGGERLLTDLRHIAATLNEAAQRGPLGLTGLLAWLRHRRENASRDGGLERSRRLESDAAAVQVITVHTSKGLEFPVVMAPFGWDLFARKDPSTATFHDAADRRVRDVGGPGSPDWAAHVAQHKQDEIDDELRLTYVAMTRAQSRLVVWWAPSYNTPQSPLHRLLLHDDPSTPAPTKIPVPSDALALADFELLAAGSGGGLAVEVIAPRPVVSWVPAAEPASSLVVAVLDRPLDLTWRRTSYSALTAAAHEEQPAFGSEPEIGQTDDEGTSEGAPAAIPADVQDLDHGLLSIPSAWDALPSGASFGTLVHALLETLDDPGDDAIRATAAKHFAHSNPTSVPNAAALAAGLITALSTPLGPLADNLALRDLHPSHRLRELDFELPLSGGDTRKDLAGGRDSGPALLRDLVPLWRRHCPTGPLSDYANALAALEPTPLRGYLTGSIDVVLRVGRVGRVSTVGTVGTDSSGRYLVLDYKTNRLGPYDEPLTLWHYRPEALERAMIEAHYPLQALLYGVALHRYLRWRQPGYDPDLHLGGTLYLFLRGMPGPGLNCADGSVPGVFSWRPPSALVTEVSDLLAAGTA